MCDLGRSGVPSEDREAARLTDLGSLAIERRIIVRVTVGGLEGPGTC